MSQLLTRCVFSHVICLDIEWLDGMVWDFDQTVVTHEDYFDSNSAGYVGDRNCFVLDTDNTDYFKNDLCDLKLRDICLRANVSDIPLGKSASSLVCVVLAV